MNRSILSDRLTRLIGEFAKTAMESRQVARRLSDLLPARFQEIKREHARRQTGHAERMALTDPRYINALEELGEVSGQAIISRVQYETHSMLYKAQQTLRSNRR